MCILCLVALRQEEAPRGGRVPWESAGGGRPVLGLPREAGLQSGRGLHTVSVQEGRRVRPQRRHLREGRRCGQLQAARLQVRNSVFLSSL